MRLFSSPHWTRCLQVSRMAVVVSAMLATLPLLAQPQGTERPMERATFYRTAQIDGLFIFYREAGPKDAPTLLLLHGLPSSSRMFEFPDADEKYVPAVLAYMCFGVQLRPPEVGDRRPKLTPLVLACWAACFGLKRAVGDADCGGDRPDTARTFDQREADQGR
jgi:hypothetical protein